jgi:hypothetical protein
MKLQRKGRDDSERFRPLADGINLPEITRIAFSLAVTTTGYISLT